MSQDTVITNRLFKERIPANVKKETSIVSLASCVMEFAERCSSGDAAAVAQSYSELRNELDSFQLLQDRAELIRSALDRDVLYFGQVKQTLESEVESSRQEVASLEKELASLLEVKSQNREYELISKRILEFPAPVTTQQEIDVLESSIATAESEYSQLTNTMQQRKKQFSLLLSLLDTLQHDLSDPKN